MRRSLHCFVVWATGVALMGGCGGDSGGGGGLGTATATDGNQVFLVQQASNAGRAVDTATQVVNDSILGGVAGALTSSGTPSASMSMSFTASFSFSSQLDLTLDLDAENGAGEDRFPNASGVIEVTAVRTVDGTMASGEAVHAVSATAGSDLVFTNPGTGETATIPEGSSWSWMLTITWSRTDSMNCSMLATAEVTVQIENMILDNGTDTLTADVEGSRTINHTLDRTDGEWSHTRSIEGLFTITLDDGVAVNTVVIEILGFNEYLVTINGEEFGPLTAVEVWALFETVFEAFE
ncbi:MAG: hypothetical protein HY716_01920 [Planctomycetes bacterium]|nr:hypothetical protein [Planctomycetota bacterium]